MGNGVGSQIVKGTIWTVLMRLSIRLLGVISIIILARVLVPEDYGLVAKAVLFSGFLELITQFGFSLVLIKNQNSNKQDYDTVWTLSLIRAIGLATILICSAPYIAVYFDEPRIENLIYCYALASAISGLNNVGIIDFQKHMQFDKDFTFNLLKKLSSFVTTLTIAFIWKSYWAFPVGVLVGAIVALLSSFIMSNYRPSFSLASFGLVFNFSKWMFFYESISAISTKLDGFLLSKLSSAEELGLYTISYEVAGIPSTEVAMPVARAALPGLAKLNETPKEFRAMYEMILVSVLMIAIPAATGLSLLAEDITHVVLGSKWAAAAPLISILAFFGIARVVSACATSGLIAFGRADVLGKHSLLVLLIKLIILPVSIIYWGYIGLAYGVLLGSIISTFILLVMQQHFNTLSIKNILNKIWRVLIGVIIMAITLKILAPYFDLLRHLPVLIVLVLEILVGIMAFIITVILLCLISNWHETPEEKIYKMVVNKFGRKHVRE